ncbi:MAG: hypothetical protein MHM6MM_005020 [Cercozoa sp. M6MM]
MTADIELESPAAGTKAHHIAACAPLQLDFEDIVFSVKNNKNDTDSREILHGISGSFRPGRLTAIMGSSGAGKTTLLNLLSKRTKSTDLVDFGGSVRVNGKEASSADMRRRSAYVLQQDLLLGTLTVRESLEFAAEMRLPHLERTEIEERVTTLISELSLDKCADTRIGDASKRGLSGGELKRACIGTELVSNPSLLFCDEPTSGLDSYTSYTIVNLLRRLAHDGGRNVVTTIHQPNSETFALFDDLLLLVDGEIVYHGPAMEVVDHLASHGFECPVHTNVADFALKIVNADDEESLRNRAVLKEAWRAKPKPVFDDVFTTELPDIGQRGFLSQTLLLAKRSLKNFVRTPNTFAARIVQTLVVSVLVGIIFYQLDNDQVGMQNRKGVLFFLMLFATFGSAMSISLTFPVERDLFNREHANNLYSLGPYFCGKVVAELPFQFVWPLLVTCIVYPMCNLNMPFVHAVGFYGLNLLVNFLGQSIGMFVGAAASSPEAASNTAPILIVPFALFAGYIVNLETVSPVLSWIQHVSPFKYVFEAMIINEFDDADFFCTQDQLVEGACPVTEGKQVVSQLSMDTDDFATDVGAVVGILLLYWVGAFVALWNSTRKH